MNTYGTQVTMPDGRVVASSHNLRGMRDYARKSAVVQVLAWRDESNPVRGMLRVTYANGAQCKASFASYHIMVDFVRNRRSWRGAQITYVNGNVGYLTKPGLIAGGKVVP